MKCFITICLPYLFAFICFSKWKGQHKKKKKKKDYAGILFPNVVPLSMKIDGGDEKLFMDPLPPQKYFLPVSARLQGCA